MMPACALVQMKAFQPPWYGPDYRALLRSENSCSGSSKSNMYRVLVFLMPDEPHRTERMDQRSRARERAVRAIARRAAVTNTSKASIANGSGVASKTPRYTSPEVSAT